jgi:hypothetical protein
MLLVVVAAAVVVDNDVAVATFIVAFDYAVVRDC